MFGFFKRKKGPVVCERKDHCISRRDIDPDALKVLYRLSHLGYTAYLVGGGVRDLLMGRKPKDFDVGTDARPNEVRRAFRNCFLVGRRFRLAHVKFGEKVIETTTFRGPASSVGEILEQAAEGPVEDNTFGTPEEDAFRRDFTVNGLFYDIKTFSVIDYVGGLKDLEKGILRAIGDPMVRFRVDPVRMMRAVKFASRLGFTIEPKTEKALRELHSCILNASVPRVCEEVFRLFSFGSSEKAFRMMWDFGLLGDLLPELSAHIGRTGGKNAPIWKYLAALDAAEADCEAAGGHVSNAVKMAVLFTTLARDRDAGAGVRDRIGSMVKDLRVPKAVYFSACVMVDSVRRLAQPPVRNKLRFVHSRDFADAIFYNRVVCAAEGLPAVNVDRWAALAAAGGPGAADLPDGDGEWQDFEPRRRRRRGGRRHRKFNKDAGTSGPATENDSNEEQ